MELMTLIFDSVVNSTFIQLGSGCDSIHQTDCQIALDPQKNGTLFLPPIQSAMISTRNKVSIKYGRVVIKAKMPKGCVPLSRRFLFVFDELN